MEFIEFSLGAFSVLPAGLPWQWTNNSIGISKCEEQKLDQNSSIMDVNQAAAAEARKQKIRNLEFSLFGEKQNDVSFFFLIFSCYNIDKLKVEIKRLC